MADRTISITPVKGLTLDKIQLEFAEFALERLAIVAEKNVAYVQFVNPGQVEALGDKYPQCRVGSFGNAEIGFVEQEFKWPVSKTTAKQESLVTIRFCQDVQNTSEERIREIFKHYGIDKVVKFQETKEIVLEFHNQEDLELLDMNFIGLKVPQLGPNAQIDQQNSFPIDKFLQKYLKQNEVRVVERKDSKVEVEEVKEKVEKIDNYVRQKEEERKRKDEETKRKMEEMEREIIEKERVRKQAIEVYQKQKREKQEKDRKERQKLQEEQRARLAVIHQKEQAERKKRQQIQWLLDEPIRKQRQQAQRIQLQQKAEEQEILKRIAAVKLEIQQQQSTRLRSNSFQQRKTEPQLEQILSQQKQLRTQKEIKLPEIISSHSKHQIQPQPQPQSPASQPQSPQPFIAHDYSKISTHFITMSIIAWLYFVLVL